MENLRKNLERAISNEMKKNSNNLKIKEFDDLINQIDKLGLNEKSKYTIPLVDTIGKEYNSNTRKINRV